MFGEPINSLMGWFPTLLSRHTGAFWSGEGCIHEQSDAYSNVVKFVNSLCIHTLDWTKGYSNSKSIFSCIVECFLEWGKEVVLQIGA